MEPTEYDIRREVEALRDLRRRSTTPGALTLDPDLPNQNPPSPTSPYRSPEAGSSSRPQPPEASPTTQASSDDPFHLFWVPASLHPEIAPAEFRAFLKEHARNPPSDEDSASLQRSPSSVSVPSGLGRKKSMLSRQYQPTEGDAAAADDTVVPLRRNRSIFSSNQNQGPQLTISDLQKLEELAEEASSSDDPAKLRNILRRSLSLNVSPLALDDADLGDEADQPIVVAPPGQFLRRTARTRIRKPGLPGDGGGHRFGERRRGPSGRSATMLERTSSDVSSSDHGDSTESVTPRARTTFSDDGSHERPESFSAEDALIYAAYARDDDDEDDIPPPLPPVVITASPPSNIIEFTDVPPPQLELPPSQEPPSPPQPEPAPLEAVPPVIHQPQPRLLSPSSSDPYQTQPAPPSRTPSPSDFDHSPSSDAYSPSATPTNSPPASSFLSTSPSPQRKEKDKKGLFGKWGSDKEKEKSSKASKKERERREKEQRESEKEQREKDSGFFGSLFGKKKHDTPAEAPSSLQGGREAAQALLGQSQRAPKSPGPPSPMGMPGMMGGAGGINNYSRYPIHVERAIYRLSHIKLANPRRPLYEQVLISNLMFWYLGVINKAQAATQADQAAAAAGGGAAVNGQPGGPPEGEKERLERERAEREAAAAAQERAEKERMEQERLEREREREQRERAEREQWEMEKKKREASPRRGALTKAVPPGAPQQRRAEMPVKGPQYEMQSRSMEKEYAGYNGNGPARSPGAVPGQGFPRQSPTSPKFNQQQQPSNPQGQEHYYYSPGEAMQQQQRLPPGAMAPVDQSTWVVGQAPPARKQANSSPPPTANQGAPHRRSRSPPPPNMNKQGMPVYNPDGGQGGARLGGRSLSATAVPSPPPQTNGKIRKGQSAYAGGAPANGRRTGGTPPPLINGGGGGGGEEEDVPLAVWQRQQRR